MPWRLRRKIWPSRWKGSERCWFRASSGGIALSPKFKIDGGVTLAGVEEDGLGWDECWEVFNGG
jgi:hypothetical protein